jgi:hypothetical protein
MRKLPNEMILETKKSYLNSELKSLSLHLKTYPRNSQSKTLNPS